MIAESYCFPDFTGIWKTLILKNEACKGIEHKDLKQVKTADLDSAWRKNESTEWKRNFSESPR